MSVFEREAELNYAPPAITNSDPVYNTTESQVNDRVFQAGEIVTHQNFGKGKVLSVKGDLITIRFSAGEKTFAASIAPIY